MCGIAGVFSAAGNVETAWAVAAARAIRHRGPDDEGYLAVRPSGEPVLLTGSDSAVHGQDAGGFTDPAMLVLAHRRLSIIDVSPSGHQPMGSDDGSLWIVFNGEIYNYIELREELKGQGCRFSTGTDTEVLLKAYETWGESCLDRLNGMWAFVIYDRRRNVLFGARDRFGVKPLYYYHRDGRFAFASEIKALTAMPFVERHINDAAVFDYLVFNWLDHEDEGFYKGIFELMPSMAFTVDLRTGELRKRRYYDLPFCDRWETYDRRTMATHAERVRSLVTDAVRLRLRSDVPVGTCLSGGLDSTTIACVINGLLDHGAIAQVGARQKVFTACYEDGRYDESRWAKIAVDATRTDWFRTYPRPEELFRDMEDLVRTQDVPFGSTSMYAQYRVMRLAAEQGVKVLLDGQGGDELFAGYSTYYRSFFAEMAKGMHAAAFRREFAALGNSPTTGRALVLSLLKIAASKLLPAAVQAPLHMADRPEVGYLDRDFMQANRCRIENARDRSFTSLNRVLKEHMTGLSLKLLLRYEDRNSMRFSIESRTPFADDLPLIEYAAAIPSAYKIHNGWSKHLLRSAMDGIVPEAIRLRRDKIGFYTPESDWMLSDDIVADRYITDGIGSFVDARALRRDWRKLAGTPSRHAFSNVWRFLNLGVWDRVVRKA